MKQKEYSTKERTKKTKRDIKGKILKTEKRNKKINK